MEFRTLERHEIPDLWSIDRSERIDMMVRRDGERLRYVPERHDVRDWPADEVPRDEALLRDCFDRGGTFLGAFDGRLVGAAVLESRFIGRAKDRLQLKFLHVGRSHRHKGVGQTLFGRAAARAMELGARWLYVSATPSGHTIDFYLRLGCRPTQEVDPDLLALEPEDIHLEFDLGARGA